VLKSYGPFTYRHEYVYTWAPDDPNEEPRVEEGFLVEGWEHQWDGLGNFDAWAQHYQIDIVVNLADEDELLDALGIEFADGDALFQVGRVPDWIYAAVSLAQILKEGGFKSEYGDRNAWEREEEANYYQADHSTRESIIIKTDLKVPTIRGGFIHKGWPREASEFINLLMSSGRTARDRDRGVSREQRLLEILASSMRIPLSRLLELA